MTTSRLENYWSISTKNFISGMTKPAHGGIRPGFKDLYVVLHKAFWNEQLVVLRSEFHDVETSLAGASFKRVRERADCVVGCCAPYPDDDGALDPNDQTGGSGKTGDRAGDHRLRRMDQLLPGAFVCQAAAFQELTRLERQLV